MREARPGAATNVPLHTEVNGGKRSLDVDPDDSALDVVRDRLGLTGAKLSCGQGVCGACTMLLDGTPVTTCLLPATSLEGRRVETVESLPPELHPIQRAFMAEDALQCGFCTPGFIVEAVHFHDGWRKEHGTATPSRDTIAAALAGHLCRCGAYAAIYRAVAAACEGHFDREDSVRSPRYEAREKVTGVAKYTVDVQLDGQLEGRILRSVHPSARVRSIDCARARAHPGVRAVVTLTGKGRLVRYAGQELAAVAAIDARAAAAALALIEVDLEVLPAAVDMTSALAPGAPAVYSSFCDRWSAPSSIEGPVIPACWHGNLRGPFCLLSVFPGTARDAVRDAREGAHGSVLAAGDFNTQTQAHTALEPHACVAHWNADADGGAGPRLTLHLSTQAVLRVAEDAAERWSLPQASVDVQAHYVGGGFGSKAELTPEVIAAVELSKEAGAPVRVVLDRREELQVGGSRPEVRFELALASNDRGAMTGMVMHARADSGVAVGSSTSAIFRLMYPHHAKDLEDWDVVTNTPPGKPFRGPGGPPSYWALEQCVDEMAWRRGEDPIALRRRWDNNPPRLALYDWAAALDVWRERPVTGAENGRYRRGVGVAAAGWFCFADPASEVRVSCTPDGLSASTACQDMGNGIRTAIAVAVSNVFGIDPLAVRLEIGSSLSVHGPTSAGSRTTSSVIPAAEDAATQMRDALVEWAARHFDWENVRAVPGGIEHGSSPTPSFVPWGKLWPEATDLSIVAQRKRDECGFLVPFAVDDMVVSKYLSGAVQITEVVVDVRLGRIEVKRIWGGYGIGRRIVPHLARSQAEGGIIQGIGYALYEERRTDSRSGSLLTGSLDDYRLAGIGDIPEINVHFVDGGFEHVTGQQVGLGELVTLAPAASIGNAVFNATGWRPHDLPIRPDRVVRGVGA